MYGYLGVTLVHEVSKLAQTAYEFVFMYSDAAEENWPGIDWGSQADDYESDTTAGSFGLEILEPVGDHITGSQSNGHGWHYYSVLQFHFSHLDGFKYLLKLAHWICPLLVCLPPV